MKKYILTAKTIDSTLLWAFRFQSEDRLEKLAHILNIHMGHSIQIEIVDDNRPEESLSHAVSR